MKPHRLPTLLLLLALFLATASTLHTQRQYETWYFGRNAGLSFAAGTARPVPNGKVNTLDGSAVISRPATGELLFYTDGKTVWDSTHTPMPNGTGLAGHESSGQPALIVPDPGDTNMFYLFTTGAANTATTATRYSTIDMRLNGGKGDVVLKNRLLLERGTEKITATRHCNGKDYWVITHTWGSNTFHVYLVTAQGITDSLITDAGIIYPGSGDIQGTFQMSPDGRKLAVSSPALRTIEVFDFDNATGLISNQQVLGQGDVQYYGLEFSPDNTKLYVNTLPPNTNPADLFQFDLAAGSTADIRASRFGFIRLSERAWQGGQLQLGGDGKIYVSWHGRDSLGVIEQPDAKGSGAGYRHNGLWLGGATTSYGLPNVIDSDINYVPGSETSLSLFLSTSSASARPGDPIDLILVICNETGGDFTDVKLDLQLPPELIPVSGNAGRFTLPRIAAGSCDTLTAATVRIADRAAPGSEPTSCLLFIQASPTPCIRPDSTCASLLIQALPVDTSEVDYTFNILSGCPGVMFEADVLFNSRRYTDTITGIRFEGRQGNQFEYGGTFPVEIAIRPTRDQTIPIRVRPHTSGPLSTVMILSTRSGDTFRIRIRTTVQSSTSPFLDISEIRTGGRTGTFDTCIRVTSLVDQTVTLQDTVWVRGESGTTLTSPALPFRLNPGVPIDLCFTIRESGPGRSDTLIIGGSDYEEFCPYCFHHMIIINDRLPGPSSSVSFFGNSDKSPEATVFPNPARSSVYIDVTLSGNSTLAVRMTDISGRLVRQPVAIQGQHGRNVLKLEISDLPSGEYLLAIEAEEQRLLRRITVVH